MTDTRRASRGSARTNGSSGASGGSEISAMLDAELGFTEKLITAALCEPQHAAEPLTNLVANVDFVTPALNLIADAIGERWLTGAPIDTAIIVDDLRGRGTLDQVGGTAYFRKLLADTDWYNASSYVERITSLAHRRRILTATAELELAVKGGGDWTAKAEQLADVVHAAPVVDPEPSIDFDDLLADVDEKPEYRWLVPGLLERQDRVIITSGEGGGKSTWLRQFAVRMAAGIHPFVDQPIDSLRALFVDCENTLEQSRRRFRPLRELIEYTPGQLMFELRPEGLDLSRPDAAAWLSSKITTNRADVLLIGPLYKLADGDPKDERLAKAVATTFDRLRTRHDIAVLIEAHIPYAESQKAKRAIRPYGASLWSRWPEFGLHLAEDGRLMRWRGDREKRDWPASLERSSPWPWAPGPDEPPSYVGPTNCADAIVELLGNKRGQEFSIRKLAPELRAIGKSYRDSIIREAAAMAANEGRLTHRVGPRGADLYSVTDQGSLLDDEPPMPEGPPPIPDEDF